MMQDRKSPKAEQRKRSRRKILKLVSVVIVALIVLVFLLLPVFISSKKGRQIILTKINNAIEGRTDFDSLSMGWFKGIKIWNFSFNDNAGQTSVQVKQLATKPHYCSILMGNLSFGHTIIDEPKVRINLKAEQAAGAPQKEISPEQKPELLMPPIKQIDLVVNDGDVKITDSKEQNVGFSRINSKINLRPPGRKTNFDISLAVADEGIESQVSASGNVRRDTAHTGWTLKGTTGDLSVEVNDLSLESLTPFFALAGLDVQARGVVSSDINSQIKDGRIENLSGSIKAKNLDVTAAKLKGDRLQTDSLDVEAKLSSKADAIIIEKLRVKSDWAVANATGTIPTTYKSFAEFISPDSTYELEADFDCDLAAVFSQMPQTFGLKEGMQIASGRLTGNIEKITEAGQKKVQGQATLSGLQGSVDGKQIALSQPVKADMQISSDKTGIKFDKLNVSSSFANISCAGTSELLNFNADVDLGRFQSELGQFADIGAYKIAGELSGKGQASVKEDKFATVGSSTLKNVVITREKTTASESAADVDFAFEIDKINNLVVIDSVKASATLGQVSIKNAVLPLDKKAAGPMRLPISASNIDLQKLQPFAVLFASFPKEMQLAGIAESDISVSSDKDIYAVTTDSTTVRNLKVRYPKQSLFEQKEVLLAFDAELNPQQKTVNIKRLQLESPQIKIKKGQFKQTNTAGKTQLAGQLSCEYDWSAVSTLAGPFLPQGLKLQGKRKDTINFTSEYPAGQTDKLLANLNTKAGLGFEKAEYMGLYFGTTEVDIQIQNGLLNIAPFFTVVNNGRLNFAASMDLRQKPMVLQTTGPMQIIDKVEINEQVSRNLLVHLNPIFKDQANVTGIANFYSEKLAIPIGGETNIKPEIIGTVGIEKMKLETKGLLGNILSRARTGGNIDAAVLPTKFVLRNGRLSYDNMQVNLDVYPTNFGGSIGPNRILNMKVVTPYVLKKGFELGTVKIGEQTTADRITLPLIGTIDRPELDWGQLTGDLLKQQLEERLREGLEGLLK